MKKDKINIRSNKNFKKYIFGIFSLCLCVCVSFVTIANTSSIKGYAVGEVPTMDLTWDNGISQKLDEYGTTYNGKRGQTYGSDSILNNADGSITNALLAGNGNVGLVKGGSSSGQSVKIGMNSFWKGTYDPQKVDGIFPQAVGSYGYDVVSEQNKANTDLDLATTYKSVTASSVEEGFPASAAVSGDYVSTAFWGMGWWTARGQGKNSWLQLEFDNEISFSRYAIWNDGSCRYDAELNVVEEGKVDAWDTSNTNAWKIQVSNDGNTWTDIDSESDNLLPVYDKNLNTPARGKFVRLFINKSVISGTETAKICKFSLFGEKKNDKNLMPSLMNGRKNASIKVSSSTFPGVNDDARHIYASSNVYATVTGTQLHQSSYGSAGVGWFTKSNVSTGESIEYKLNKRTSFKSYQLFNGSATAVNSYMRADWTSWRLQTSKDNGSTYQDVHVVNRDSNDLNIVGGQPTISSFDIANDKLANTTEVTNIKLVITGLAEYVSRALLSQFKIYAGTLNESGIDQTNQVTFRQNIKEGRVGAESSFGGQTYEANTTISQNGDNYVVTNFKNTSTKPLTMRFYTTAHHYRNPEYTQTAAATKDVLASTRTTETASADKLAWVSAATIASKVEGGEWAKFGSTATSAYGEFTIPANGTRNIVTYIDGMQYNSSNYPEYASITADNSPSKSKALSRLKANVTGASVFTDTAAYWKEYWLKSAIDIYDKTVEEYYYNSFYIVGSATRVGAAPASLFGPFMTSDSLAWGGTYVTDYNLYGTYTAVASANREELLKPLVVNALEAWGGNEIIGGGIGQVYGDMFNRATNNSFTNSDGSMMFQNGVDGVLSSVVAGPHGYAVNMQGFYKILFTSAYAAMPVLSYYDMTQGKGEVVEGVVLDNKLEYKYLKDIMRLWEQILIYENGVYKVKNDAAWEDEKNNMGNAFSLASVHMFTQRLVARAAELGYTEQTEPRIIKWKHIDANLEAYPIAKVSKGGVMRDCFADTLTSANKNNVTYNGRTDGLSNPNVVVAQVIPTDQLGLYSDPAQKQIMRNSIFTIESWENINGMPTFFSTAARVGYGSTKYGNKNGADKFTGGATSVISQLRKVAASGLRFNNVSKLVDPLQLIDTCGGSQGVNDTLVQSFKDIITLFPAYESNKAGRFINLQVKGGYLVSAAQDASGKITFAKVESQFSGKVTLALPAGADWNIIDSDGNPVTVTRSNVGAIVGFSDYNAVNTIAFDTVAGKSYYVVPSAAPANSNEASAQRTDILFVKED